MNQCRLHPELIKLLRLEELFPSLLLSSVQIKEGNHELSTKLLIDKDCETPTHFVEKNIENNYYWNEWELRKKAI